MQKKTIKRNLVLGILFFLPVTFLLFLYPAKHNYIPLEIVKTDVLDVTNLLSNKDDSVQLKDNITVLNFIGNNPENYITEASNLKELVYDKFTGFKKFQIVTLVPVEAKEKAERLRKELTKYKPLEYWKFVYASQEDINKLFSTLRTSKYLNFEGFVSEVYVIDKELNQRGRLDDRSKVEIKKEAQVYPLTSYNMSEVAVLKNKMSEDVRVIFTEYRQKRKGEFNSTTRRADDLKAN
ncbi:hypothetical protein [Aurantibacter sp.]|uniref:hypothetical protein n=1 Tax=Aurantibacter sp. TaxID=2807103 RepID=UPI0035C7F96A